MHSFHGASKTRNSISSYLASIAGIATIIVGLAVLSGWLLHIVPLIQFSPNQAPMQPMTAWGFVVSGSTVMLIAVSRQWSAGILAVFLLIWSTLILLEYWLAADLGIDQLLGRTYLTAHTSNPGRMSPMTAACFLFIGLSMLAASSRILVQRSSAILGISGSIIVVTGLVTIFALVTGLGEAYAWGLFTRMASHTAGTFVVLGVGIMAVAWTQKPAMEELPGWFPLSVGLATAVGSLGLWQALVGHKEAMLSALSRIVLIAGLLLSLLLALSIHFAQRSRARSHELLVSQQTFEQLFEAAPDGIAVSDVDGRILRINLAMERLFGYNRADLVGQLIETLVPERFRNRHYTHRQRYHDDPQRRPMGAEMQ